MNPVFILALLFAAGTSAAGSDRVPVPMTETHIADLGCVAWLGMVADLQRRGAPDAAAYPDVRETGKSWAGIVGQRVMDETGQPRELVAMAIHQAVADWQVEMQQPVDPRLLASRFDQCHRRMAADLAASQPLPKPETAK